MSRFKVRYLYEAESVIDASDIADVVNRLRTQNPTVEIVSIQKMNLGAPISSGESNIVSTIAAPAGDTSTKPKPIQRSSLSKRQVVEQLDQAQRAPAAARLDEEAVMSAISDVGPVGVDGEAKENWAQVVLDSTPISDVDSFSEPVAPGNDAYESTLQKFGRSTTASGKAPQKAVRRVER